MSSQPEIIQYDVGVYQLEVTDPVDGGVGAVSNTPLLNLANRTAYLKKHVDDLESGTTIPSTVAPINSPALTGTPTAPTPPLGDNSQKIAPTAFVQGTINGITTKDVSGGINVTLSVAEAGAGILVFTGALTANIAVIVPASTKSWIVSNRTSGAFTLTLKTAAGTGIAIVQGRNIELWCDGTNVVQSTNDFTDAALTGTPTAPTPASADSSTKVANTAFVYNATDGMATINVAGSADVTVSALQYGSAILKLTGAITANINLILPSIPGQWIVANGSTGSFNITAKTAAGTGVVLPSNLAVVVYCDGVNVYFASSSAQKSFQTFSYAPAAGTTSLTVLGGYTPGNILVEKNGALLEPADFTATDGSTITVSATTAGDSFTVYVYATFSVANALPLSGGTLTGTLNGPASASEASAGLIALATTALAQALTDDTTALTPKKLADAFKGGNQSLAASGFQKLPGGSIWQWGFSVAASAGSAVTFPVAFPSNVRAITTGIANNTNSVLQAYSFTATGFMFRGDGSQHFWMALGN